MVLTSSRWPRRGLENVDKLRKTQDNRRMRGKREG